MGDNKVLIFGGLALGALVVLPMLRKGGDSGDGGGPVIISGGGGGGLMPSLNLTMPAINLPAMPDINLAGLIPEGLGQTIFPEGFGQTIFPEGGLINLPEGFGQTIFPEGGLVNFPEGFGQTVFPEGFGSSAPITITTGEGGGLDMGDLLDGIRAILPVPGPANPVPGPADPALGIGNILDGFTDTLAGVLAGLVPGAGGAVGGGEGGGSPEGGGGIPSPLDVMIDLSGGPDGIMGQGKDVVSDVAGAATDVVTAVADVTGWVAEVTDIATSPPVGGIWGPIWDFVAGGPNQPEPAPIAEPTNIFGVIPEDEYPVTVEGGWTGLDPGYLF